MITKPDHLVDQYLADHETVIFDRAPDLRAYLAMQWFDLFVAALAVTIMFAAGNAAVTVVGLIGEVVIISGIAWRLADRAYTRYVLTDHRAIRMAGVLRRHHEWISWKKVTDVSVQRTVADRWFGTATIRIQSANEHSGFAAMDDVPDPRVFAEMIVEMVNAAHGAVTVPPDLPGRR